MVVTPSEDISPLVITASLSRDGKAERKIYFRLIMSKRRIGRWSAYRKEGIEGGNQWGLGLEMNGKHKVKWNSLSYCKCSSTFHYCEFRTEGAGCPLIKIFASYAFLVVYKSSSRVNQVRRYKVSTLRYIFLSIPFSSEEFGFYLWSLGPRGNLIELPLRYRFFCRSDRGWHSGIPYAWETLKTNSRQLANGNYTLGLLPSLSEAHSRRSTGEVIELSEITINQLLFPVQGA